MKYKKALCLFIFTYQILFVVLCFSFPDFRIGFQHLIYGSTVSMLLFHLVHFALFLFDLACILILPFCFSIKSRKHKIS